MKRCWWYCRMPVLDAEHLYNSVRSKHTPNMLTSSLSHHTYLQHNSASPGVLHSAVILFSSRGLRMEIVSINVNMNVCSDINVYI